MILGTYTFNNNSGTTSQVEVAITKYLNISNQNALIGNNGNYAFFSVCLPEEKQEENEVFIKDYSENSGLMVQLIKHNIISAPKRIIERKYTNIYVCELLK